MTCQGCNADTSTDRTLCPGCHTQLQADLAQLPGIARELTTQTCRQSRRGQSVGVNSHGADRPLPYDQFASDVAGELVDVLLAWAKHTGQTAPPKTITPLAAVLTAHNWAADPEAGAFADELAWELGQAHHAIDNPTAEIFLGLCCEQRRYARAGRREWTCPDCATVIDVQARRVEMLDQARDVNARAAEISRGLSSFNLPVDRALIRQWVHRGKLVSVGNDRDGHALYRVGDALDLVTAMARRPVLAQAARKAGDSL